MAYDGWSVGQKAMKSKVLRGAGRLSDTVQICRILGVSIWSKSRIRYLSVLSLTHLFTDAGKMTGARYFLRHGRSDRRTTFASRDAVLRACAAPCKGTCGRAAGVPVGLAGDG